MKKINKQIDYYECKYYNPDKYERLKEIKHSKDLKDFIASRKKYQNIKSTEFGDEENPE